MKTSFAWGKQAAIQHPLAFLALRFVFSMFWRVSLESHFRAGNYFHFIFWKDVMTEKRVILVGVEGG